MGWVGDIPQADRLIRAAGGEDVPIGTEAHRSDTVGVIVEIAKKNWLGWVSHLPQVDVMVSGTGSESAAVALCVRIR